jgi:hypothetical protein
MPVQWTASAVAPKVCEMAARRDRSALIADVLDLESVDDPDTMAYQVEAELRSLAALADVPLRLRDLDIATVYFSRITASAAEISGADPDVIQRLLEDAR